jgi:hypothetical protein
MNRIDSQLHKLKPYDAKDKSVRSPLHLSLSQLSPSAVRIATLKLSQPIVKELQPFYAENEYAFPYTSYINLLCISLSLSLYFSLSLRLFVPSQLLFSEPRDVYPDTVNLSKQKEEARNIAIKIKLLASDADPSAPGMPVRRPEIFSKYRDAPVSMVTATGLLWPQLDP